ncbi:hypothetical protein [Chitinibacter tainanensis]|uniref:hypothetical protein n=1 Tax=Chitinibacter tainanensis TaxID=230667 RepID=UPI00048C81A9|nr:hypothetical protein [Chitinibacter tainanensis]
MPLIAKSTDPNSTEEITITSDTQIDAYDLQYPNCYLLIGGVWYVIQVTPELLELLSKMDLRQGKYTPLATTSSNKHRP